MIVTQKTTKACHVSHSEDYETVYIDEGTGRYSGEEHIDRLTRKQQSFERLQKYNDSAVTKTTKV